MTPVKRALIIAVEIMSISTYISLIFYWVHNKFSFVPDNFYYWVIEPTPTSRGFALDGIDINFMIFMFIGWLLITVIGLYEIGVLWDDSKMKTGCEAKMTFRHPKHFLRNIAVIPTVIGFVGIFFVPYPAVLIYVFDFLGGAAMMLDCDQTGE